MITWLVEMQSAIVKKAEAGLILLERLSTAKCEWQLFIGFFF
jgi:hypothetical protein